MKTLDIIVPIRNEEENLANLVKRIDLALSAASINYRIYVIDDHSTDRSRNICQELKKSYPIDYTLKKGKKGKGFSVLEGFDYSSAEFVAFIDADLQYPPEVLPEMLAKLESDESVGVVVANRKVYKTEFYRKIGSRLNALLFGRVILGLKCDVQSGLKVFRRNIVSHIEHKFVTPWTLDMPLLMAAKGLGYGIRQVDISFEERANGASKVSFIKTGSAIALCALKLRLFGKQIYHIQGLSDQGLGSGVYFRHKKYVTHSKLPIHFSALETVKLWQKLFILGILSLVVVGLVLSPVNTLIVLFGLLSAIYFTDVLFNLFIILKSLHFPPELSVSEEELSEIKDSSLPTYSILCPLYKEALVISHFVDSIDRLDWPKDKLDVHLLLEENDLETIEAARSLNLPSYFKITIVPHSFPKTKPKACNYGLHHVTGEFVVIYDAEDLPDPDQLKKAFIAFQNLPENTACVQAKLNYYNPHHNILTRLFTAEYSLWFDIVLPGFQSINTAIPLGGTSNHFKTKVLQKLHGWDAFNVTEDADLGIRLFREGYKTAIIDSVTLEEANSNVKNWIRQRSRWIKGYMQTYLVHMRNPFDLIKKYGWHSLIFQLVIGARMYFMLINPILWTMTFSYFALYRFVGPQIEALFPPVVFYMAVFSLVVGNFVALYNYMIGCAKRGHWSLIKYVFLVPFYWLLVSIAAVVATIQLIFNPHYWEKTNHGLHISKKEKKAIRYFPALQFSLPEFIPVRLLSFIKTYKEGGALVMVGLFTSVLNYGYNAFLSRHLKIEDFGLISLIGNFVYISSIPFGALSRTVSNRSAFIFGKYSLRAVEYWKHFRRNAFIVGILISLFWLGSIGYLAPLFRSADALPFLLFTPVLIFGVIYAVDTGYLQGNLKFSALAALLLSESLTKVISSVVFVSIGRSDLVYASVPLSIVVSFFVAYLFSRRVGKLSQNKIGENTNDFSYKFFFSSVLIGFSTIAFLSFDLILAKIFLPPAEAGKYALVSLMGKMIYFIGNMFSQFILPIVSKHEGDKGRGRLAFYKLFGLSTLSAIGAYTVFGLLGGVTGPLLLGPKALSIAYLLPIYGLGILLFSIANDLITYDQVKKRNLLPILSFFIAIAQIIGIVVYHRSTLEIVIVMLGSGILSFVVSLIAHLLFAIQETYYFEKSNKKRVLFFNWRDTKHVWSGGAEVYIHELAKELIKKGYDVSLICGNDRKSLPFEVVDGVNIHRYGGFYTVYVYAPFVYLLKFRGKVDAVIDSENGIPFFTPLYVKEPVIGLVHHIHQNFFKNYINHPMAKLAKLLEAYAMPFVYRNCRMITVSQSSKDTMSPLGLGKRKGIELIHPGIDPTKFKKNKKTKSPSITYLGRLKAYKSLDVVIESMVSVLKEFPDAKLRIAGFGESRSELEKQAKELGIELSVEFLGKVSEEEKIQLLGESWVFVYPSSHEGWGITAIEASASGTPVVASDVPGLRDSVKNPHSGYLVKYGDPNAFSTKISELIRDTKLRKKLEKGGVEWSENFTWEKSADKLIQLIEGSL